MERITPTNPTEGKSSGSGQLATRVSLSLLVLALGFPASASGPHQDTTTAAQPDTHIEAQSHIGTHTGSQSAANHPIQAFRHWIEVGTASWYGLPFQGRKTANGETYDMNQLTCAHRTLPLGSWVRVTNLKNKKTVVVRVNDRGPMLDNRVVDLSYAAAQFLGLKGVGKVRLVSMHEGDPELAKALLAQVQVPALVPALEPASGPSFAASVDTIPLP